MSESFQQFTVRTSFWIAVCAIMFVLGRNSIEPKIKDSELEAEIARKRAETYRQELDDAQQNSQSASSTVTFVPDGDTIKLLDNRQEVWVRLEGIDCPERDQPMGDEARQFTKDLCFGVAVQLTVKGEDSYGRVLADVFVDGQSVNLALLEHGLAWHHVRYNQDPRYAKAEETARSKSIGIWAKPDSIPPWEWRKLHPKR